jgi:hypothetical protein
MEYLESLLPVKLQVELKHQFVQELLQLGQEYLLSQLAGSLARMEQRSPQALLQQGLMDS